MKWMPFVIPGMVEAWASRYALPDRPPKNHVPDGCDISAGLERQKTKRDRQREKRKELKRRAK